MKLIDRLSAGLASIAGVLVYLLIAVMIYEVVSRYAFGAPTLWAGDLTYMLGGAIFVLAAAYGLREDGHVSIDFVTMAMPARLREGLRAVLLLLVALPAFGWLSWVAAAKAISAYQSGTTDPVSAFAPKLWPLYSAIAVGLIVLSLQVFVSALRSAGKAAGHHG